MIDAAKYLGREFHWRTYNCWDFVRDVWLDHTGIDLGHRTPSTGSKVDMARAFVEQEPVVSGGLLRRIEQPEPPCIVLMVRSGVLSHVGVLLQDGLLHLQPRGNVSIQDLRVASIGFTELRFYK